MKFYITFGSEHKEKSGASLRGCYTVVLGESKEEARTIALKKFGQKWSSIYDNAHEAGVLREGLMYVANPKV